MRSPYLKSALSEISLLTTNHFLRFLKDYSLSLSLSLSLHFNGHFSRWTWVSRYQMSPFWILLELKMMKVVVATGAIRRAKAPVKLSLPTNHRPLSTSQMPFLPPNQQCQSTEGKSYWRTKFQRNPSSPHTTFWLRISCLQTETYTQKATEWIASPSLPVGPSVFLYLA